VTQEVSENGTALVKWQSLKGKKQQHSGWWKAKVVKWHGNLWKAENDHCKARQCQWWRSPAKKIKLKNGNSLGKHWRWTITNSGYWKKCTQFIIYNNQMYTQFLKELHLLD